MMTTTSNKRRMATTVLSMLPEEMEMEVLLRLPVKSILRFSAVCRRWAALLSSEEFCSAWTKIAESTTTEPAAQLLFFPWPPQIGAGYTEVRSGDGRPLLTLDGVSEVMAPATCRGLTLARRAVESLSGRYHVFNAATRAVATLPPPPSDSYHGDITAVFPSTAGLGFDDRIKKHKVVCLVSSRDRSEERLARITCEVYALGRGAGDNRWRAPSSVDGFAPSTLTGAALFATIKYNPAPVFVDGFLHWLVVPRSNDSTAAATSRPAVVLSFSVADETFGCWVRRPPFDWENTTHMTELDGSLCIVRDLRRDSRLLEIWNYSNGGDCWSLKHRIDLVAQHAAGRVDLTEPQYVRVIGKKKVIFIATSKCKVVTYDPMSGTLETILQFGGETTLGETCRSLARVSMFKESLTPVYNRQQRNSLHKARDVN